MSPKRVDKTTNNKVYNPHCCIQLSRISRGSLAGVSVFCFCSPGCVPLSLWIFPKHDEAIVFAGSLLVLHVCCGGMAKISSLFLEFMHHKFISDLLSVSYVCPQEKQSCVSRPDGDALPTHLVSPHVEAPWWMPDANS